MTTSGDSVLHLLNDVLRMAMVDHAAAEQPRECCGLLVLGGDTDVVHYMACRNVWGQAGRSGHDRFLMHPEDWAAAEDFGRLLAVVHSHPNASANPSMADRVGCEKSGVPWLVVGWPSGVIKELLPSGWQAPYKNREFSHGVLDCYTLIQDWYRRELAIELPDYEREDGWWEKKADGTPAQDLYMENFAQAGFVRVDGAPMRHDVILMQVKSDKANHGAIYQGDGILLHHLHGRPSCTDVYGGYWQRHTAALLRHQSLLGGA